jgi:hypothetical protein
MSFAEQGDLEPGSAIARHPGSSLLEVALFLRLLYWSTHDSGRVGRRYEDLGRLGRGS